ncbi:hypothetical protein KY362_07735 [Candidatus Woesearchaeota archaeon]|nr:hypothetical protein [Candidatus Woesearchaeota archaeon]
MKGRYTRRKVQKSLMQRAMIVILALLAMSLFASAVSAVGVLPSKKVMPYEPGQKITYPIEITNNGAEDLEVMVYARGEFAENAQISPSIFRMSPTEERKKVDVQFEMPRIAHVAGQHTLEIVAVGSTPSPEGSQATVKADLAVISKLVLEVPYPEKFAEARVHVLDTEVGKPAEFALPIFNKGSKTIDQAYFKIDIFTAEGERVEELFTEKVSVKPGESTKLTASTTTMLPAGGYRAIVTLFYDGEQTSLETIFHVGELTVEIKSLVVDKFSLGGVAKFDILLHNKWSTEIKNIYAEMQITGEDNKVYTDFKTVAIDIQPQQLGRLEGYWYTEGVAPGVYTARLTLHYANRVSEKNFELEVHPDKIVVRDMLSGQAISSGVELDLKNNAFLILVIVIMAVVIGVLVYMLKRKKKGGGGSKQNRDRKIQFPASRL